MTDKEVRDQMIQTALNTLAEHFDTVHIFTSHHEGGSTLVQSNGTGNFYSRLAQIQEFVIRQDERVRQEVRDEEEP